MALTLKDINDLSVEYAEPLVLNSLKQMELYLTTVAERIQDARTAQLMEAELVSDYDGWIYTYPEAPHNNGFFESIEACREWFIENAEGGEPPEYAFCCEPNSPQFLDYDELVQEQVFVDSFEEAWEHVSLIAESKFRLAIDEFNEAIRTIYTWTPDYTRKVRVGDGL